METTCLEGPLLDGWSTIAGSTAGHTIPKIARYRIIITYDALVVFLCDNNAKKHTQITVAARTAVNVVSPWICHVHNYTHACIHGLVLSVS